MNVALTVEDRKAIGTDIKTVQFGWPLGMPLVRKMDRDLWEVRSDIADGIERVIAWQLGEAMKAKHIARTEMAARTTARCRSAVVRWHCSSQRRTVPAKSSQASATWSIEPEAEPRSSPAWRCGFQAMMALHRRERVQWKSVHSAAAVWRLQLSASAAWD